MSRGLLCFPLHTGESLLTCGKQLFCYRDSAACSFRSLKNSLLKCYRAEIHKCHELDCLKSKNCAVIIVSMSYLSALNWFPESSGREQLKELNIRSPAVMSTGGCALVGVWAPDLPMGRGWDPVRQKQGAVRQTNRAILFLTTIKKCDLDQAVVWCRNWHAEF